MLPRARYAFLIVLVLLFGLYNYSPFPVPLASRVIGSQQHRFSQSFNIECPSRPDGSKTHTILRSVSRADGTYFDVQFGDHKKAANVNFVPHPHWNDTWIIVAQRPPSKIPQTIFFAEIVCNAQFRDDGVLACVEPPGMLPIPATVGTKCLNTEIEYLHNSIGPRDARVFYGPIKPYAIFGSNGVATTCLGQWIQDLRMLTDWGIELEITADEETFHRPTELHRPGVYMPMEKNWFAFWDFKGSYYVHYDVSPRRAFAKLNFDGTVGEDLAPLALDDAKCLQARMPDATRERAKIHQATNSLAVTMCERADPACAATEQNTFIFTLFHYKTYVDFHSVYEPYVMMFRQTAPFDLYAISQRPLWIHGRGGEGTGTKPNEFKEGTEWNQTEMVYVTSISWKQKGMKYHGFIDDLLLIGFGVEDKHAGGIDVVAGDLFTDLGSCFEL